MANTYYAGLRCDDDFVTNELPESWRKGIFMLFPNGDMPLTALTGLIPTKKENSATFHWWKKDLASRRADIVGVYSDVACSSAYASGGVAGSTLYVKVTTADVAQFRTGHAVRFVYSGNADVTAVGKVMNTVPISGTHYAIAVKLLEADDNGANAQPSALYLASCDVLTIIGTINPQGGNRPQSISSGPTQFTNYTQIFRTPLDLSRTSMETETRTEDLYNGAKTDALRDHGIDIERSIMYGVGGYGTGSNGKKETYTNGIVPFIRTYGTFQDFRNEADSQWVGQRWIDAGTDWLDTFLEVLFRYGSTSRLCLAGSGALLGLQKLVRELGMYTLTSTTMSFGLKVTEWETPFGTIHIKRHPLMTHEATERNCMLFLDPSYLEWRYITDTKHMPDKDYHSGGDKDIDGLEEEFLTEAGLAYLAPETGMFLAGVGLDNTLAG